jgi:TolA-binding protein
VQSKVIIAIVGLFLFSAYTAAVMTYGYQKAQTAHAEQQNKDLQAAITKRDELQAQIDQMAGENAQLIFKLKNQPKEATKHATNAQRSDTCNLTLGAVSVLNVRKGYPVGTPENPGFPAGKDAAPSTVTGERALDELESCENDYQLAITRLNGLIDSVRILQ